MEFQFEFTDRNDKSLLQEFIEETRDFLKALLFGDKPFGKPVKFIDDTQSMIQDVYNSHGAIEFSRLSVATEAAEPAKLTAAGLTGKPLIAKLSVLKGWGKMLRDEFYKAVRHILAQCNSIIGSLVHVTGLGEAAKEFKDLVENAIDYVND